MRDDELQIESLFMEAIFSGKLSSGIFFYQVPSALKRAMIYLRYLKGIPGNVFYPVQKAFQVVGRDWRKCNLEQFHSKNKQRYIVACQYFGCCRYKWNLIALDTCKNPD